MGREDQRLMDMLEGVPQHVTDTQQRDRLAKHLWTVIRPGLQELRRLCKDKPDQEAFDRMEEIFLDNTYREYRPPVKPTLSNLLKQARQYLNWHTESEPNYGELDTEYYSACGHDDMLAEQHAWLYVMFKAYLRSAIQVKGEAHA